MCPGPGECHLLRVILVLDPMHTGIVSNSCVNEWQVLEAQKWGDPCGGCLYLHADAEESRFHLSAELPNQYNMDH